MCDYPIVFEIYDVGEACVNGTARRVAQANTYILLTKRVVKMAGYWPSSLFALWTETNIYTVNT